jgi:Na+-translocating ferredoxin:NAD+ oxidoreductase subunit B
MSINLTTPRSQDPPHFNLVEALNQVLPQTQCRRCGFEGCLPYAQAMAQRTAPANRCPPGGQTGLETLSELLGIEVTQLDSSCGVVGPRTVAFIQPDRCIGCTKCIDVCPTDAIVGGPKKIHYVIEQFCTGCDLCLPPCPVDCIDRLSVQAPLLAAETWGSGQIGIAKNRYDHKKLREAKLLAKAALPIPSAPPGNSMAAVLDKARLKAAKRLGTGGSQNATNDQR